MPLLFESISHGEVPFGFFNIETDMVLLDNFFFFASDVSARISELSDLSMGNFPSQHWEVYVIESYKIGNLMGAIAGIDFHGFIGEIYSHFPFPHEPDKFKQNPEGFKTRTLVEEIVKKYASPSNIKISIDEGSWTISIGKYVFSRDGFHKLLRYLWLGGYPRWKDNIRPDYIIRMKDKVEHSNYPLFFGIKGMFEGP